MKILTAILHGTSLGKKKSFLYRVLGQQFFKLMKDKLLCVKRVM